MELDFFKSICLLATFFVANSVQAYDFSEENADNVTIYYNVVNETKKTCEVTTMVKRTSWSASNNFSDYTGDVNIPSSANGYQVIRIGEHAFAYNKSLNSVSIPSSVTTIESFAFLGCKSLTSVKLSDSVTKIEEKSFSDCTALTSIDFPLSLTSIGTAAFANCTGITTVNIPQSVSKIGVNPFQNCSNISKIVVESDNPDFNSDNDCNAIIRTSTQQLITGCMNTKIANSVTSIEDYAFYGCTGLSTIEIPNSVKTIGGYAFYKCSALSSLELPNSVKTIGEWAFFNCSKIPSLEIPCSVDSIGSYSFRNCSGLKTLIIPKSVTTIGSYAFWNCSNLTSITSHITNVTPTGSSSFYGCTRATLYVCKGMVSTYQALGDWRSISRIQEIPNATLTMACNDKGKLLINDEIEFTNDLGQTSIYLGTECTLTFQPNDGCQLTQVLLDGKDITSSIEKNQFVTKFSADTKINVIFTAQSETKRSTAVMKGDINGDGKIDISDVTSLVNSVLENQ